MTVRVRFAPSPTGYLHIGGARTAIYNYLYARALGGTFILRIEDTDLERSKREYEESQIEDLKWLGLDYDEGPDKPGEYGPYRQSERTEIYTKYAQKLVDQGLAYYAFDTDEELEQMREAAQKAGKTPHYSGKWRNEAYFEEAAAKLAAGEKAAIRFKAPQKSYVLQDKVRGRVVFPENMVGDFVIMRSNGLPVYNFCCVVDDMLMKITHVVRGEDHLSNTVRQLMLYEAFGADVPEFAHASLLIGKDRQKLSKRHGATSVTLYKDESYLPTALANYLVLLGWSHPEEKDVFDINELDKTFDLERLSKSPAIYDLEKLKWMNGQHLRALDENVLLEKCLSYLPEGHFFTQQPVEWQKRCLDLFKTQIEFFSEFKDRVSEDLQTSDIEWNEKSEDVVSWESTPEICAFFTEKITSMSEDFVSGESFSSWMNELKKEKGIKGKPLFMGSRLSLTGKTQGPELVDLIPLTPKSILLKRLENVQAKVGS